MTKKSKETIRVFNDNGIPSVLSRNPAGGTVRVLRMTEPTSFVIDEIPGCAARDEKIPYLADRKFTVKAVMGLWGSEWVLADSPMTRQEAEKLLNSIYRGLTFSRMVRSAYRWTALVGGLLVALALVGGVAGGGPATANVVDAQAQAQAQADARPSAADMELSDLPDLSANAISYGAANEDGRTLLVFADPQCPFCKQLESELAALPKDVAVRVFPVAFKSGSAEIAASVYCSIDQSGAWRSAVLDGDTLSSSGVECDGARKVAQNNAAFAGMGFKSTPTIVNGYGKVAVGALSGKDLLAFADAK